MESGRYFARTYRTASDTKPRIEFMFVLIRQRQPVIIPQLYTTLRVKLESQLCGPIAFL